MGLTTIITWPIVAVKRLVSLSLTLCINVLCLPFRLVKSIFNSLRLQLYSIIYWSDNKLKFIRNHKPFVYLFPISPLPVCSPLTDDIQQQEDIDSNEDDSNQSISTLIQELLALSQSDSKGYQKQCSDTPQDKLHQLIQELQEIAVTDVNDKEDYVDDDGVTSILTDLEHLENYLTQFLNEQEKGSSMTNERLETIIEETTSKESSPAHPASPILHRQEQAIVKEEEQELSKSQHEISQALLMLQKVTNSDELKNTLQQLAELHGHSDNKFETPPSSPQSSSNEATPPSALSRRQSMKEELDASQNEMDNIVNSLNQQHKFISTQQELQSVMDSLNIHAGVTPTHANEGIYDSLTPVYAKLEKKPCPPDKLQLENEGIYDSILPQGDPINDTPPPIPLRRTLSDTTSDSCDNSPLVSRRYCSCNDRDCQRKHKRNRKHHHHHHHCRHSSPDRCCHHRPRSRERHHHHHTRHRSTSNESHDEERCCHESSGYDSQPHVETDFSTVKRRSVRSYSDAASPTTPPTPRSTKRGFFGLFGKKSTSLTSLSSNKDIYDQSSISSYKL